MVAIFSPKEVVQRNDKVFTLIIKNRLKNVSIDRLKVVYLPNVTQRIPTSPANLSVPSDSRITTDARNSDSFSTVTRSGRVVKRHSRFRDHVMSSLID